MERTVKNNISIVIGVLVLVGILAASQYFDLGGTDNNPLYRQGKFLSKPIHDTPPLPEGEETYNVSGNMAGPKISKITIAPLGGARPGVNQSWKVSVQHTVPVRSVDVTLRMDNGYYPVSLALTEGTELDGVWTGSWNVKDDHVIYYQAKIVAKSETDSSEVTPTFQPLPEDL